MNSTSTMAGTCSVDSSSDVLFGQGAFPHTSGEWQLRGNVVDEETCTDEAAWFQCSASSGSCLKCHAKTAVEFRASLVILGFCVALGFFLMRFWTHLHTIRLPHILDPVTRRLLPHLFPVVNVLAAVAFFVNWTLGQDLAKSPLDSHVLLADFLILGVLGANLGCLAFHIRARRKTQLHIEDMQREIDEANSGAVANGGAPGAVAAGSKSSVLVVNGKRALSGDVEKGGAAATAAGGSSGRAGYSTAVHNLNLLSSRSGQFQSGEREIGVGKTLSEEIREEIMDDEIQRALRRAEHASEDGDMPSETTLNADVKQTEVADADSSSSLPASRPPSKTGGGAEASTAPGMLVLPGTNSATLLQVEGSHNTAPDGHVGAVIVDSTTAGAGDNNEDPLSSEKEKKTNIKKHVNAGRKNLGYSWSSTRHRS